MSDEVAARYRIVHQPARGFPYRVDHRDGDGVWQTLDQAANEAQARQIVDGHKTRASQIQPDRVIAYID